MTAQQQSKWQKLGARWPMWFTAGVVIYFVFRALGLSMPDVSSNDNPISGPDDAAASTAATVNTGELQFKVSKVEPSPNTKQLGTINLKITFDIKNNTKHNITLNPNALVLKQGDTPISSTDAERAVISPHLSIIVPATFAVAANGPRSYELLYAGQSVYSGRF